MKINVSLGIALTGVTLIVSPVQAATFDQSIVKDWNNVTLEAIQNSIPGTRSARSFYIVNTGIFDAWAAYDPVAIGTQFPDLQRPLSENTLNNKAEAISYAAYTTLLNQFPTQKALFDSEMGKLGLDPTNITSIPATIGLKTAQSVINSRQNDGSNESGSLGPSGKPFSDYTGYTPVNLPDTITNTNPSTIIDPNRWQPVKLPNGSVQEFLTPYWNQVTPFALESSDQLRPTEGPKNYFEDPKGYIEQAEKIVKISADLTDEQKAIAEFWAAGRLTTSGLWNQLAQEVSTNNNYTLDDDAKLFFLLNNAAFDASIAGWDAKIAFDSERPHTAIHYLASKGLFPNDGVNFRINPETGEQEIFAWAGPGQGNKWIPGKEWQPYLGAGAAAPFTATPPFSEFVSGHSIYSASMGEILRLYTGSDAFGVSRTVSKNSGIEPGGFANDVTLHWDTFSDAVAQAGNSRIYGGIHFDDANLVGQKMGRETADIVWRKSQYYIQGRVVPEPSTVLGLFTMLSLFGIRKMQRFRNKVQS
ncbi:MULTISPECIES: DUF6851 domain-containing protein [unclassified Nostoc]|uniref:DUF6851 domain-containing protein n=1 Tax=unclassified Nostoc TaxID=2593658 RepID=UPI002AD2E40E|nr:PEP-CTERM sorting domain-containing protein [Nostoc sp. DedQUE03]MDZ7975146.1 PEP-CTERM sorting domain-containing protein [Nostoc sp. DedQUE03]MDZ8045672.1 PEP-CTERM sorting domain-containing protein [Nostoc sp. DedQUE02]